MPDLQQTFVCLNTLEKETIRGLTLTFTPPVYTTAEVVYDTVLAFTGLNFLPERKAAFEENYKVTHINGLPFPPPLDNIVEFDPTVWDELWHFVVVDGAPYGDGCAFSNFDVDHSGLSRPFGT